MRRNFYHQLFILHLIYVFTNMNSLFKWIVQKSSTYIGFQFYCAWTEYKFIALICWSKQNEVCLWAIIYMQKMIMNQHCWSNIVWWTCFYYGISVPSSNAFDCWAKHNVANGHCMIIFRQVINRYPHNKTMRMCCNFVILYFVWTILSRCQKSRKENFLNVFKFHSSLNVKFEIPNKCWHVSNHFFLILSCSWIRNYWKWKKNQQKNKMIWKEPIWSSSIHSISFYLAYIGLDLIHPIIFLLKFFRGFLLCHHQVKKNQFGGFLNHSAFMRYLHSTLKKLIKFVFFPIRGKAFWLA